MIDTKDGLGIVDICVALDKINMGRDTVCPEALNSALVSLDAYYREYKVSFLWRMRN